MNGDLLTQYNRELSFIRRLAGLFAQANPGIAEHLHLRQEDKPDPHVERLIQAFAFISGRVRQKLDDEFPEITESLLGVLYPHYLNPIPSMGIVQMELASEQDAAEGYRVPAETPAATVEQVEGEPCRFQTVYPVTLWPIKVESAKLARPPFGGLGVPETLEGGTERRAAAILRLVLRCVGDGVSFQSMPLDSLRFFLHGESRHACWVYELLLNNTIAISLAGTAHDKHPVSLPPRGALSQVGFESDEGTLPYGPRSFIGYRLLTEYFAFPEKFRFVELSGNRLSDSPVSLKEVMPKSATNELQVFFYLNQAAPDLEQHVTKEVFRLGCTPVVNLYKKSASPIDLTHTEHRYRVVPDVRSPQAHEVYTVDRVTASRDADGQVVEYQPFYSVKHAASNLGQLFWHASREPSDPGGDGGTEVYLSLVDLAMKPSLAGGWTLHVDTTCLNRDMLSKGKFSGELKITEGAGLVSRVSRLTPFTETHRPAQKHGAIWRLISHLTLNHLSLTDGDEHANALREILKLYDFADRAETQKMISGVKSVKGERVTGRTPDGTVCRGIEVTLTLDESCFTANELFLFASVMERFLALYCTVNSFSRLVVKRVHKGELRRWPPRVGEKVLI
jgi:type VI secretion system protein ImpG